MSQIETVAPNPGTIKENNRELAVDELDAVAAGATQSCSKQRAEEKFSNRSKYM